MLRKLCYINCKYDRPNQGLYKSLCCLKFVNNPTATVTLYKKYSDNASSFSLLRGLNQNHKFIFYATYLGEKEKCLSCLCGQRRHLHTLPPHSLPHGDVQTESEQKEPDAIALASQELDSLFKEIRQEVGSRKVMKEIATYYFDGRGKSLRPLITLLMSRAINSHLTTEQQLLDSQREIAKITEMVHASSLLHDDVIDGSDTRRGKPAVHSLYNHKQDKRYRPKSLSRCLLHNFVTLEDRIELYHLTQAVMVGDYVLSVAATMAARLRHEGVLILLAQVLVDLVNGEFMQLGSKEKENERFKHYLKKSFNKTASLIAFSCKAVALLAGASEEVQEIAFQYGKNCGIAFQLIDDMLDFTASPHSLGKPNLTDLKSGLATAPVLFACEKFPELNAMIMRRFQEPEDARRALEFVVQSDGLKQTKFLAEKHCQEAVRQISRLKPSPDQRSLILILGDIVNRPK